MVERISYRLPPQEPIYLTYFGLTVDIEDNHRRFTKRQRSAIIDRDGHCCQFPTYSEGLGWGKCQANGDTKLHVHHILSVRWLSYLGYTRKEINNPLNLITLCEGHHLGTIHPDATDARDMYRAGITTAYVDMAKIRNEMVKDGVIYWNTDYDEAMLAVVQKNTDRAILQGWHFPELGERNNNGKNHNSPR